MNNNVNVYDPYSNETFFPSENETEPKELPPVVVTGIEEVTQKVQKARQRDRTGRLTNQGAVMY